MLLYEASRPRELVYHYFSLHVLSGQNIVTLKDFADVFQLDGKLTFLHPTDIALTAPRSNEATLFSIDFPKPITAQNKHADTIAELIIVTHDQD